MVLTVPLRAAVDSCEGLAAAGGGSIDRIVIAAAAAGQQADAQGGGEHQSKGSLFMTFILQSCIVLVAFGNGYQYTDGL